MLTVHVIFNNLVKIIFSFQYITNIIKSIPFLFKTQKLQFPEYKRIIIFNFSEHRYKYFKTNHYLIVLNIG